MEEADNGGVGSRKKMELDVGVGGAKWSLLLCIFREKD